MSYEPTAEEKRENMTQLVKFCLNPLGIWNLKSRKDYVKLADCMDYIVSSLFWNGEKMCYDFKGMWNYAVQKHDRKDKTAHERAIDEAVDPLLHWSTDESVFMNTVSTFVDIMSQLCHDLVKLDHGELDVKKDNSKEGE